MEDKEYYTPQMSDLYFGYEYEIDEDWDILSNKQWHKQVYGINGTNPENLDYLHEGNLKKIRTKYLDIQDIIDLGWEINIHRAFFEVLKDVPDLEVANKMVGSKVYNIIYHKPSKWLTVKTQDLGGSMKEYKPVNTIYYGFCKSKNELKKLMKDYLNIPI
jgi:hypothetical protein